MALENCKGIEMTYKLKNSTKKSRKLVKASPEFDNIRTYPQYRNLDNDQREAMWHWWCAKNNVDVRAEDSADQFFDALDQMAYDDLHATLDDLDRDLEADLELSQELSITESEDE